MKEKKKFNCFGIKIEKSNLLNKYSAMQILWGNFLHFFLCFMFFYFLTLVKGKICFVHTWEKASSFFLMAMIFNNFMLCLKELRGQHNKLNLLCFFLFFLRYIFLAHVVLMQPNKNIQISLYLCTFNPLSHLILPFLYRFQ